MEREQSGHFLHRKQPIGVAVTVIAERLGRHRCRTQRIVEETNLLLQQRSLGRLKKRCFQHCRDPRLYKIKMKFVNLRTKCTHNIKSYLKNLRTANGSLSRSHDAEQRGLQRHASHRTASRTPTTSAALAVGRPTLGRRLNTGDSRFGRAGDVLIRRWHTHPHCALQRVIHFHAGEVTLRACRGVLHDV